MVGIPTTVVTRGGFTQVVANAYAGFGFPDEAPVTFEFPIPMFLEGSDLTPINENIDKMLAGLTTWKPKLNTQGVYPAASVTAQGKDYQTALDNLNALSLKNMWGDGLPLQAATEDRVKWIMTGTDLSPDTVVGSILPKGGLATVQSIAVNLAMAGGRPEYMPVLIAVVKAIADPGFNLQNISPSTNSNYLAVVVNGSIAKDIRLNSGYSLMGPDSLHPAGQVIGRAIALIEQNLGGTIPGIGAMELYGGMRITNAVFAEDESAIPSDWAQINVERGFAKGSNVVTVMAVSSASNITVMSGTAKAADAAAQGYLYRIARFMATPNMNVGWGGGKTNTDFTPGLVLIPRTWAQELSTLGWSEQKVKQFLWDNSKLSWAEMMQNALSTGITVPGQPGHITTTPDQIRIVVAGGAQSAHAYWMECGKSTLMVGGEITLPANWNDLLKAAETDLGPAPAY
jgi:hypothetical protein